MSYPELTVRMTNGPGVASFVLGILALLGSWIPVLNFFSILLTIAAFVCAMVGLDKKHRANGTGLAWAGFVLAVVSVVIGIIVNSVAYTAADDIVSDFESADVTVVEPEARTAEEPAEPKVPLEELQAIGSAQEYLDYSGYSRLGLINQLSNGEGFPADTAEKAVDSLSVDWNAEAAESAQEYLDYSTFSCDGLVEQLSSEYGDQFTPEQALHGATAVGLCQ